MKRQTETQGGCACLGKDRHESETKKQETPEEAARRIVEPFRDWICKSSRDVNFVSIPWAIKELENGTPESEIEANFRRLVEQEKELRKCDPRNLGVMRAMDLLSRVLLEFETDLEEVNLDHDAVSSRWLKAMKEGKSVDTLALELREEIERRRMFSKPVFTAVQVEEMLSQILNRLSQSYFLALQIQGAVDVQDWQTNALLDLSETTIRGFLSDLKKGTETISTGKTFNFLLGVVEDLERERDLSLGTGEE
jgi:hypothetical protein